MSKKTYLTSATLTEPIEAKSKEQAIEELHIRIRERLDLDDDERIPLDLEFEAVED